MRSLWTVGLAIVLLGGSTLAGSPAAVRRPAIGPGPVAVDAAGLRQKLAQQRGRVIVLNMWATWCPPCVHEFPDLVKLDRAYQKRGVVVIGLAAYMFGGFDKKTDNPDVAQKPNGDHHPDAKKPDPNAKRPTPRPKRNDKDPDDEVPVPPPSEVKKTTEPIPPESKKPEPLVTVAIAPAPHPVPFHSGYL